MIALFRESCGKVCLIRSVIIITMHIGISQCYLMFVMKAMLYYNLNIIELEFCLSFSQQISFLHLPSFEKQLLKHKQNEKDRFVLFLLMRVSKAWPHFVHPYCHQ